MLTGIIAGGITLWLTVGFISGLALLKRLDLKRARLTTKGEMTVCGFVTLGMLICVILAGEHESILPDPGPGEALPDLGEGSSLRTKAYKEADLMGRTENTDDDTT